MCRRFGKKRCGFEDIHWATVMSIKVKNMIVNKIAQFNYFLLYDKIPQSLNLWKRRKIEHPECQICKCINDCIHFLFHCTIVSKFWSKVNFLINRIYDTNIKLQWKHIICGYMLKCKKLEPLNLIIMIATFCVYKSRILSETNIWRFLIEELSCIQAIKNDEKIKEFINAI